MPTKPLVRRYGQVDFGSMDQADVLSANNRFVCRQGKGPNVFATAQQISDFIPLVIPDPLLLGDGAVGAPTYSYISDPTTGTFLAAVGELGVTANGVQVISVSSIRAALKMGSGTGQAPIVGGADIDTTAVGNAGAGEQDLITFSLPANSLSVNGKGVRITVWGRTAANANTKTIKLHWGANPILTIGPSAINGLDWSIDGLIIRSGATAQKTVATETLDGTAPQITISSPTETLSGAIIIKVTGEGVSNNDIV